MQSEGADKTKPFTKSTLKHKHFRLTENTDDEKGYKAGLTEEGGVDTVEREVNQGC